ncbi:hypothetical protein BN1723_004024 [Verticillium longisporum]|uniref:Uncharacterized protein n=1 Tax=Verticillium longisporum TaxID=100787 RepID=A0A0G4MJ76_VERLO|nr:hypothetical protein BN1723_004024 [Verticillium longisporum]
MAPPSLEVPVVEKSQTALGLFLDNPARFVKAPVPHVFPSLAVKTVLVIHSEDVKNRGATMLPSESFGAGAKEMGCHHVRGGLIPQCATEANLPRKRRGESQLLPKNSLVVISVVLRILF